MRGCGGIGRRVGLRIRWETVQVQILSSVPNERTDSIILSVLSYIHKLILLSNKISFIFILFNIDVFL